MTAGNDTFEAEIQICPQIPGHCIEIVVMPEVATTIIYFTTFAMLKHATCFEALDDIRKLPENQMIVGVNHVSKSHMKQRERCLMLSIHVWLLAVLN